MEYAEAAVIAREALEEMLMRLQWMALKPRLIVDVGGGAGEGMLRLQAHYPEATVVVLDHAMSMLQHAKTTRAHCICAEGEVLPFADQSVDFIFANLLLPWHADHKKLFSEWRRVLRPDGLLMFSTLGLDTLREYQSLVSERMVPQLMDMHDVGDKLLAAGFADPVLDVNYYTTCYRSKEN